MCVLYCSIVGLLSQAEEIYRRVLGRRESRVGTNNVDTLTSAYWLGVVLFQQVSNSVLFIENILVILSYYYFIIILLCYNHGNIIIRTRL